MAKKSKKKKKDKGKSAGDQSQVISENRRARHKETFR